jgi:hypothetical protein
MQLVCSVYESPKERNPRETNIRCETRVCQNPVVVYF